VSDAERRLRGASLGPEQKAFSRSIYTKLISGSLKYSATNSTESLGRIGLRGETQDSAPSNTTFCGLDLFASDFWHEGAEASVDCDRREVRAFPQLTNPAEGEWRFGRRRPCQERAGESQKGAEPTSDRFRERGAGGSGGVD